MERLTPSAQKGASTIELASLITLLALASVVCLIALAPHLGVSFQAMGLAMQSNGGGSLSSLTDQDTTVGDNPITAVHDSAVTTNDSEDDHASAVATNR